MLTDEQEEIIGEALKPLFEYLEHEVIVDVAERIRATMMYSRTGSDRSPEASTAGIQSRKNTFCCHEDIKGGPRI